MATRLSGFQPGRDILIYVGTTNPETTESLDHRSRLLSAVVIQPGQVLATKDIIPPRSWQESVRVWGSSRWGYAMAVTRAAVMVGRPFPDAREVVPTAYSQTEWVENRGNIVEALGAEREAVMDLDIVEIHLNLSKAVREYLEMRAAIAPEVDKAVKQEITRIAMLIQQRVGWSGEPGVHINPQRYAPKNSTGSKARLGHITRAGDRYLRRLLVIGATGLIRYRRKNIPGGLAWVQGLLARKPVRLVTVALANKMARIAWAVMRSGEIYREPALAAAA